MTSRKLAGWLGAWSVAHPGLTLTMASVLTALSLAYAATELRLEPDRNALIRSGRDWNDRFEAYRRDFEGTKDFIVVVQDGTRSERERFVDRLLAELEGDPAVRSVLGRLDPQVFSGSRLLLMDPVDLDRLHTLFRDHADALQAVVEAPDLDTVLRWVDRQISSALVQTVVSGLFGDASKSESEAYAALETEKADSNEQVVDLGFLLSLLGGMKASLEGQTTPESPWKYLGATGEDGYITVRDSEIHLVSVARTTEGSQALGDGPMLDRLQAHLERVRSKTDLNHLRAGITGQRAISASEMRATVNDTQWAGVIALLGVAVVFVLGFGRGRNPLLAVLALMMGVAWSAGALTWVIGHLTVLSVAFTSILVGLGIDFGIHVVARFEEVRRAGLPVRQAVVQAVERSGPGNVAGAITTSLAFFGVGFSEFLGLAELGIIAGMGVLLCLLAQLTVLPALLVYFAGARGPAALTARPASSPSLPPTESPVATPTGWSSWRGLVGVGALLATAGMAVGTRVPFDGNLLALQAEGVEAVDLELELVGDRGSAFAVSRVDTLEAARSLERRLLALPEVAGVESVTRLIPEDVQDRVRAAKRLAEVIPKTRVGTAEPLEVDRVARRIEKLRFKLRPEQEDRWDPDSRPEQAQLQQVRSLLDELTALLDAPATSAIEALNAYQAQLGPDLEERLKSLRRETDPVPMTLDRLPPPVRNRMVASDQTLLIRIHPRENIWEDAARTRFVQALRTVDPEVTGIPVQNHEASRLMLNGYLQGGLYSLVLVLLVLAVDLRRPRDVIAALLPLVAGAGWTLGIMFLLGLRFNLANLIIVPLMIGMGIDIGVHLVHRWREDGQAGRRLATSSTGRAVILSSLTTMVGFGSLTVAQHQGIHSLGLLLAIGVACTLGAALFVLAPALGMRRPARPAPNPKAPAP